MGKPSPKAMVQSRLSLLAPSHSPPLLFLSPSASPPPPLLPLLSPCPFQQECYHSQHYSRAYFMPSIGWVLYTWICFLSTIFPNCCYWYFKEAEVPTDWISQPNSHEWAKAETKPNLILLGRKVRFLWVQLCINEELTATSQTLSIQGITMRVWGGRGNWGLN